jgi:FKBP-type peptidyl-prolyl cis-trans isomerase FkpA/FKBP-type peptidyl-prolyl cis-trans isomerase FklB
MKPVAAAMALTVLLALAPARAQEPALDSEEDKIYYVLGLAISQNVAGLELSEEQITLVQAGLADGALGRDPRVDPAVYGPKIQATLQARAAAIMEQEKEAGTAFLAEAAKEPGAETLESGVVYVEEVAGEGAQPKPTDTVKIHYHGTLRDGTVFDSSRDGDPAEFALNQVIGCFSEGVQKMKVGGKAKLTCPPDTAYGDRGRPPQIRPGATLVFEVELVEVEEPAGTVEPAAAP